MNVERIRELADIIGRQQHTDINAKSGFTMSDFDHECGSPACIAGWAIELHSPISNQVSGGLWHRKVPKNKSYSEFAAELLEIDEETRAYLFFGDGSMSLEDITPRHAAAVLRNLAATGKVNWSVGAPVEA